MSGGGLGKEVMQRVRGKCSGRSVLEQFGKETGAKRAVAKGLGTNWAEMCPVAPGRSGWLEGGRELCHGNGGVSGRLSAAQLTAQLHRAKTSSRGGFPFIALGI